MTVVLISASGEGTVYEVLLFRYQERVYRDCSRPRGFEKKRSKLTGKLAR
jgi:hypothetical protein